MRNVNYHLLTWNIAKTIGPHTWDINTFIKTFIFQISDEKILL
jgi:hypothetical protein